MSSSVGPRPPVVITTFERLVASLIASSRRASSSPTIVLSLTSIPSRLSCSVSHRLLVSVRSGANNSDPMAMISAVSVSNKCTEIELVSRGLIVLIDIFQEIGNRRRYRQLSCRLRFELRLLVTRRIELQCFATLSQHRECLAATHALERSNCAQCFRSQ